MSGDNAWGLPVERFSSATFSDSPASPARKRRAPHFPQDVLLDLDAASEVASNVVEPLPLQYLDRYLDAVARGAPPPAEPAPAPAAPTPVSPPAPATIADSCAEFRLAVPLDLDAEMKECCAGRCYSVAVLHSGLVQRWRSQQAGESAPVEQQHQKQGMQRVSAYLRAAGARRASQTGRASGVGSPPRAPSDLQSAVGCLEVYARGLELNPKVVENLTWEALRERRRAYCSQ